MLRKRQAPSPSHLPYKKGERGHRIRPAVRSSRSTQLEELEQGCQRNRGGIGSLRDLPDYLGSFGGLRRCGILGEKQRFVGQWIAAESFAKSFKPILDNLHYRTAHARFARRTSMINRAPRH